MKPGQAWLRLIKSGRALSKVTWLIFTHCDFIGFHILEIFLGRVKLLPGVSAGCLANLKVTTKNSAEHNHPF